MQLSFPSCMAMVLWACRLYWILALLWTGEWLCAVTGIIVSVPVWTNHCVFVFQRYADHVVPPLNFFNLTICSWFTLFRYSGGGEQCTTSPSPSGPLPPPQALAGQIARPPPLASSTLDSSLGCCFLHFFCLNLRAFSRPCRRSNLRSGCLEGRRRQTPRPGAPAASPASPSSPSTGSR